jgi:kynurenine formamidase
MSEENKTLLRRYVDKVWHKRNLGALEELMSLDFLDHADKEVYAAPPRASGASTRHTKRPSPTPPM